MGYLIALFLLILLSVVLLFLMKKFTNRRLTNFLFVLTIFFSYVALVIHVYRQVGANDWNFRNTLPTANVSPFMFCILPLALLPGRIGRTLKTLVSLLTVGMFLSPTFSCIYYASIHYKFHASFLLDFYAHFALCLWGIYLVRSGQVTPTVKESLIGGSIIVAVALVMMALSAIFDVSYFGLSLRGKHNIYNQVLTSSSALSALLYFVGLIGVLVLGFLVAKIWERRKIPDASR